MIEARKRHSQELQLRIALERDRQQSLDDRKNEVFLKRQAMRNSTEVQRSQALDNKYSLRDQVSSSLALGQIEKRESSAKHFEELYSKARQI